MDNKINFESDEATKGLAIEKVQTAEDRYKEFVEKRDQLSAIRRIEEAGPLKGLENFKRRNVEAQVITSAPYPEMKDSLNKVTITYSDFFQKNGNDWKKAIQDHALTSAVTQSLQAEKAVLETPADQKINWEEVGMGVYPEDLQAKPDDVKAGTAVEATPLDIDLSDPKDGEGSGIIRVNGEEVVIPQVTNQVAQTPAQVAQEPVKAPVDWSKVTIATPEQAPVPTPQAQVSQAPQAPQVPQTPPQTQGVGTTPDYQAEMERDFINAVQKGAITINKVDIPLGEEPGAKTAPQNPETPETAEQKEARYKAIAEAYLESIRNSNENIERVESTLESRKGKTLERLKNFGLTCLTKPLEAWKNTSPKKKFIIGALLAAAAVPTAGLTSIISKGLSTMTFANAFYDRAVKAKTEKGEEIKKGKLVLKSLGLGFVTAMATSAIIADVASHAGDFANTAGQKLSLVKAQVMDWLQGILPQDAVAGSAVEALSKSYPIKPGDNLTNIIKNEVIPHLPGAANLTEDQKRQITENLFARAQASGEPNTINQFENINIIQPGQTLDLNEIKFNIEKEVFDFNGTKETILEHAKRISGTVSSGVTGAVSQAPEVSPVVPSGAPDPYAGQNFNGGVVEPGKAPTVTPNQGGTPTPATGPTAVA